MNPRHLSTSGEPCNCARCGALNIVIKGVMQALHEQLSTPDLGITIVIRHPSKDAGAVVATDDKDLSKVIEELQEMLVDKTRTHAAPTGVM